jgi:rhomboid protease GluP
VSGDGGRARACPRCGALNGADFARCIRCGSGLSPARAWLDRARAHADGRDLWGTKGLLGLTTLVFARQAALALGQGGVAGLGAIGEHGVDAIRAGALPMHLGVAVVEPWRLLSAVFVHFGALHFVMNMVSLANLGRLAEPTVGTARLVVVYAVTGAAGFAATALLAGTPLVVAPTAGASGAVLGVMGLMLGWMARRRDPRWKELALWALFYGVFFGFAMNRAMARGHGGMGVNNTAHIAGLVCGTLFGAIFAGPRRSSDLGVNAAAAVAVLACVASLLGAERSPLWRRLAVPAVSERPGAGLIVAAAGSV